MTRRRLAKALVLETSASARRALIRANARLADRGLADEIRRLCYQYWTTEPALVRHALAAINTLASIRSDEHTRAVALWIKGIQAITKGRFEAAVTSLMRAGDAFSSLGLELFTAQSQVALILALGMLGRYGEAMRTGREALEVFLRSGDELAAGKIQLNLSNLSARQGRFRDAVRYCSSALTHFTNAGEPMWQALAENSLANGYMELSDPRRAEMFYRSALSHAKALKQRVTEAEIEASLGRLEMTRGRYAEALAFLERSRTIYDTLTMPHQSAIADMEIAGAYRELNLLNEASELYSRAATTFRKLRMRSEEASSLLELGRLLTVRGRRVEAARALRRARKGFERDGNVHMIASCILALAELDLNGGRTSDARELLAECRGILANDEDPRDHVRTELISGLADIIDGRDHSQHLDRASADGRKHHLRDTVITAELWLGRGARSSKDLAGAERHLKKAAAVLSEQRRELAAEEFGISFITSRAEVYEELTAILLSRGKVSEAFKMLEASRSVSWLHQRVPSTHRTTAKAAETRAKLNYLYHRLDNATNEERQYLLRATRDAENHLAEIDRRSRSLMSGPRQSYDGDVLIDPREIRKETTLIEYTTVEGSYGAFVVNSGRVRFVPIEATPGKLSDLLEALHFQFNAFRVARSHLGKFLDQIRSKIQRIVSQMHDLLISPLQRYIKDEIVTIIPSGLLNYVPFAALWDGDRYLVQRYELRTAPSAHVAQRLRRKGGRKLRSTFLIGFADPGIPLVEQEVQSIAGVLNNPSVRIGPEATFEAFSREAQAADIVHVACHGEFRADAPLFSNLHLANGWITVRDLLALEIRAELVTLSACETGLSKLFPGEELMGLARGFMSAGARSLIVSLWAVNDAAASGLMPEMYRLIAKGVAPAAALRQAQISMIDTGEDIYHWAPFIYVG